MRRDGALMATITWTRKTRWTERPLRTCRTLHHCSMCKEDITCGQQYRDGGYHKRAHEACVREFMRLNAELDAAEDRAMHEIFLAVRGPKP
jgi:hypothetical protein